MLRYDRSPLDKSIKLDSGFLRIPVTATRVGIFVYRKDDGTPFRELRLPEEVFNKDSMATLAGVPVTDDHPSVMVDSTNAKGLSVGFTSDKITRNGNLLDTSVTVTDQPVIDSLEGDSTLREVSCGYKCDVELKPGIYKGQHYDGVQRNIRYNHLAIVRKGRAGSEARLHMDGADYTFERFINLDDLGGSRVDCKINIDGCEFNVSETVAQAVVRRHDGLKAETDKLREENTKLKEMKSSSEAKIDALDADLKKAQEVKLDEKAIQGLVSKRVALVESVKKFCKDSVEGMEEKTDRDLMVAIIKSANENFDAEGKDDSYLAARVDHMIESSGKEVKRADGVSSALSGSTTTPATPVLSAQEKIDSHKAAQQSLWEKPLLMSKQK